MPETLPARLDHRRTQVGRAIEKPRTPFGFERGPALYNMNESPEKFTLPKAGRGGATLVGHILPFSSLTEGMAHVYEENAALCEQVQIDTDRALSRKISRNKTWYGGVRSMEDVNKILDQGWSEGIDKVSTMTQQAACDPRLSSIGVTSRRRKRKRSTEGEEACVDRYLEVHSSGGEDFWVRYSKTESALGSIVSIGFNWGGNCGMSAEQLFWSGAAACLATKLLEEAGYSVELFALIGNSSWNDEGKLGCTMIRLKGSHEQFRFHTVASAVCHAGVFRSHGFRWITAMEMKTSHGLGSMIDIQPEEFSHLPIDGTPVILDAAYDVEGAISNVRKCLAPWIKA